MKLKNIILLVFATVILCSSCGKVKQAFTSQKRHFNKSLNEQYNKALDYYQRKRFEKALAIFQNIQPAYAGHQRLDTIMFYSANCYYFNNDFFMSSEMYDQYRTTMGRSIFATQADLYYALSLYNISPDVQLDQTYTVSAIAAFEDFLYRNPGHEMEEQCKKYITELYTRVYQNQVHIAKTYFDIGYYKSAIVSLNNVLKKNPNTPHREEIMFFIVRANYEYARSSIPSKRRERFFNTIDAYYNFITEFPKSKYIGQVRKFHANAKSITEGEATISDVTGRVISKRQDFYQTKEKLEKKIANLEKKNRVKAAEKLRIDLDIVNKTIKKFEELMENRKRELEINQAK